MKTTEMETVPTQNKYGLSVEDEERRLAIARRVVNEILHDVAQTKLKQRNLTEANPAANDIQVPLCESQGKKASRKRRVATMTTEARLEAKRKKAETDRNRIANMTPEERSEDKRKKAETKRNRIASMTPEERCEAKRKKAEADRNRIANMTPEERSEDKRKKAETKRNRIASMTPEERSEDKRKKAEAQRNRIASMTPEKRSEDRKKKTQAQKNRVSNMTPKAKWETKKKNAERMKNSTVVLKRNGVCGTPNAKLIAPANGDHPDGPKKQTMEADDDAATPTSCANEENMSEKETTYKRKLFVKKSRDWDDLMKDYLERIASGPTFVCTTCGGLFYREGVRNMERFKLIAWDLTEEFIERILYVKKPTAKSKPDDDCFWMCVTCYETVRKTRKVPRLALSNGLDYPVIPEVLKDLNQLEERMISPRIPFMQIRRKGFEQQWSLRGNVVNVECPINKCVTALPRRFDNMSVIQLKLMRRMRDTHHYMYEKIRPANVIRGLNVLLGTPLYQQENVTLSTEWADYQKMAEVPFIVEEEAEDSADNPDYPDLEENEVVTELLQPPEDNGAVDDEHTLLFDDSLASCGIKIAPAEGNTPVPLYRDPTAELLSFPTIYCGQKRTITPGVKLSYTDIAKSELRRYDRRCARPEKVLYSFKKSFNEKLQNAYQICLRQKRSHIQGEALNAGMMLSNEIVCNMIAKNDAYEIYKKVRCNPGYWKDVGNKMIAGVRQMGPCTFFLTLSAAETRWTELLAILSSIDKEQPVAPEDVLEMPREEKARLIRSDPVTCMRHFDHKLRALLNALVKPTDGVYAPYGLADDTGRIEFQRRGSPHYHGMHWLKNAPVYNPDCPESEKECIEFVDKFITCKRDTEGEMAELIGYQVHKHTHTCEKGNRKVRRCRFNFPKPPMSQTRILKPLPDEMTDNDREKFSKIYTKIESQLNAWGRDYEQDLSFEDFLHVLGIENEEEYLNAVRSAIKIPTLFYRRLPKESFINTYNKKILLAWRANMDIQFVLNSYACAKYVASYISKSGGGVSKLLRAANADSRDGNVSIDQKLKRFATTIIKGSEICAQEAAAFCLGIHMTHSSRSTVFINTGRSTERVRLLKPKKELIKLDEGSEDIFQKGPTHAYSKRPKEMENVCYAEFCTQWASSKDKGESTSNEDVEDEVDNQDELDLVLDDDPHEVRYRKLDKAKIMRCINYSKATNPQEYWREQIMLFHPWRNELAEVEDIGDHEAFAKLHKKTILENSLPYYNNRSILTNLEANEDESIFNIDEIIRNQEDEDEEEATDGLPEALQTEEDSSYAEETVTGRTVNVIEKFLPPKLIPAEKYIEAMRSLNPLQRKIVLEVLHRIKTDKLPFYIFLSGGAGVGKSHVINAIVQCCMVYYNKLPNVPPDALPVIVAAPTGKAAFNVFGMTLHSTFRIPAVQYAGPVLPLSDGNANTLRLKFKHTKLFIVEEVSMVGASQLNEIDTRLRQLFDKTKIFGGKSVLAVGHLRQLPPVGMKMVFEFPKLPGAERNRMHIIRRNPLWSPFQYFELEEIMRQRNAHAFCKALNNMAEGEMDDDDIALIKSRIVTEEEAPEDAVWLFEYIKDVNRHNEKIHGRLDTEAAVSVAIDSVTGEANEKQKENLKNRAKTWSREKTAGIEYTVNLQVGGLYFVTTNVDVSDGLFNGATGELKAIDYGTNPNKPNEKVPITAWIEFSHVSVGQKLRSSPSVKQRMRRGNRPSGWTPIDIYTKLLPHREYGMRVTRKQIPLFAANAMTIHKSQGSSLAKVVLTINGDITNEKLYVACSRATSLEGLFIIMKPPPNPRKRNPPPVREFKPPDKPPFNDPVTLEMQLLKKNPVQFQLKFPNPKGVNTLYVHNIEGFLTHRQDLENDIYITCHDYLILLEPKIRESSFISVNGYELSFRSNSAYATGACNSEGILVFTKVGSPSPESMRMRIAKGDNGHALIFCCKIRSVNVFAVYKSPTFSRPTFIKMLLEEVTKVAPSSMMVVGDMNIDMTKIENAGAFADLEHANVRPVLPKEESTTEYNTQLDLCFTNVSDLVCNIYECYYSYHKGLMINW